MLKRLMPGIDVSCRWWELTSGGAECRTVSSCMFGNADLLGCAQPGDWKIYIILYNICDCEIDKSQECALQIKNKVSSNQRN